MARSRNFGRSHSERRKIISKKERKSKHQPQQVDVRTELQTMPLTAIVKGIAEQRFTKRELRYGWQSDLYKRYRTVLNTGDDYKRIFFRDTLAHLEHLGFDLRHESALVLLCNLSMHCTEVLQPVNKWIPSPESGRSSTQLRDLLRHCFALYAVPSYLEKAWEKRSMEQARKWYIQLGQGTSMRELENTPIPVSKKMAHHLRETPRSMNPDSAFRWAQIRSLGGNNAMAIALQRTRLGWNHFVIDDYWQSVMRWIIAQDYPHADLHELIDWLSYKANANEPIQLAGRTVQSVARRVTAWHAEFRRANYQPQANLQLEWEGCKHPNWSYTPPKMLSPVGAEFEVVQLLSAEELREESRRMHHCVRTYAYRANQGQCAIFSLRKTVAGVPLQTPLATIEYWPHNNSVVQVRAACNKNPESEAMNVLREWARVMGIKWK